MPKKKLGMGSASTPEVPPINYEPFGPFASNMADAFEFVGKTPHGQLQYRGRKGTKFQDVHFVTDPTSKMSSLFLEKDGQLTPTEFTNLNPQEVFNMRNQLVLGSAQQAQKQAPPPVQVGNPNMIMGVAANTK